jgi:nitrate reductase gamma subunit
MSVAAIRDAAAVTGLLLVAVWAGSRAGRDLDPALFGYLGATVVAAFAVTWRASAFWRRRPTAFYGRAFVAALRDPRRLRTLARAAGTDLAAQRFIARRSRTRWLAHLALSLGTLASFAITLPLVFGWLRFTAEGQHAYRPVVLGIALPSVALDGAAAWLVFHALTLAGVAVFLGAVFFLAARWRGRALPGATAPADILPLALLLAVAATGLALPASRTVPGLFAAAAFAHELTVVALLVALPFSKLGHVLVRPLQLGVRLVRAPDAARVACTDCGAALVPVAQLASVATLLAARGMPRDAHLGRCPACRRRAVAAAQARLVGASFHPDLVDARPRRRERAA